MQKTYYYTDELNDDFAGTNINSKQLPDDYEYLPKSRKSKVAHVLIYRAFVTPIIKIYSLLFGPRVKNKKITKKYKKQGAYIYGNHTNYLSDAFMPTRIAFPRSADIVVNPDAVSIKVAGGIVRSCGGIPVPDSIGGLKRFTADLDLAVKKGHWVAIYPEAHIWPYYTGIRPFGAAAFKYPAKSGAPVFGYTTVYKKRLIRKKPKKVVYVDGPFFADMSQPLKARTSQLRDEVYTAMCQRAQLNSCEYVNYVRLTDPYIAGVLNNMQQNTAKFFFPKRRREARAYANEMCRRYGYSTEDYSCGKATEQKADS